MRLAGPLAEGKVDAAEGSFAAWRAMASSPLPISILSAIMADSFETAAQKAKPEPGKDIRMYPDAVALGGEMPYGEVALDSPALD